MDRDPAPGGSLNTNPESGSATLLPALLLCPLYILYSLRIKDLLCWKKYNFWMLSLQVSKSSNGVMTSELLVNDIGWTDSGKPTQQKLRYVTIICGPTDPFAFVPYWLWPEVLYCISFRVKWAIGTGTCFWILRIHILGILFLYIIAWWYGILLRSRPSQF